MTDTGNRTNFFFLFPFLLLDFVWEDWQMRLQGNTERQIRRCWEGREIRMRKTEYENSIRKRRWNRKRKREINKKEKLQRERERETETDYDDVWNSKQVMDLWCWNASSKQGAKRNEMTQRAKFVNSRPWTCQQNKICLGKTFSLPSPSLPPYAFFILVQKDI